MPPLGTRQIARAAGSHPHLQDSNPRPPSQLWSPRADNSGAEHCRRPPSMAAAAATELRSSSRCGRCGATKTVEIAEFIGQAVTVPVTAAAGIASSNLVQRIRRRSSRPTQMPPHPAPHHIQCTRSPSRIDAFCAAASESCPLRRSASAAVPKSAFQSPQVLLSDTPRSFGGTPHPHCRRL